MKYNKPFHPFVGWRVEERKGGKKVISWVCTHCSWDEHHLYHKGGGLVGQS